MTKSLSGQMLDYWIEQKKSLPPAVIEHMELNAALMTREIRDLIKSDDVVFRRAAFAMACCIGAQIVPILESTVE